MINLFISFSVMNISYFITNKIFLLNHIYVQKSFNERLVIIRKFEEVQEKQIIIIVTSGV